MLDGRLPNAERAEVTAHIADCADCLALVADTSEALRDLEPAKEAVRRFPFERRPAFRHVAPWAVAAALFVAVCLPAYLVFRRPPPRMVVADLVGSLPDKARLSDRIWKWTPRSGNLETPGYEAGAFQLGARLVDFQLSVQGRRRDEAKVAALRIHRVLDRSLGYEEEARHFDRVNTALEGGAPLSEYRHLVDQVTPAFEEGFSHLFMDFGKWTAAGRLSALARDSTFFERQENRQFLKLLLEDPARLEHDSQPVAIEVEVRDVLDEVARRWDAGELTLDEYDKVASSLEWILGHYERMVEDFAG